MISDLKSLVDPLGETEFLTLLRERKLIFLPGCGSRRFETLLTWEALNHLLDSATLPLDALRVLRESIPIPTNFYLRQGRVDPAALSKLLDQGVSLIFNQLDEHVPALRALCKNLARKTSERVSAAAIMTSGRGGALKCHYDAEDLVILQIAGTKRWQVFNSPIVNPVPGIAEKITSRGTHAGFRSSAAARRFSLFAGRALASLRERSASLSPRLYPFRAAKRTELDEDPSVTAVVGRDIQTSADEAQQPRSTGRARNCIEGTSG